MEILVGVMNVRIVSGSVCVEDFTSRFARVFLLTKEVNM